MIDRRRNDGELREEFSVLGSTGNVSDPTTSFISRHLTSTQVYTVTIDRTPRCNCPDALKGNHCKHILFILIKGTYISAVTN